MYHNHHTYVEIEGRGSSDGSHAYIRHLILYVGLMFIMSQL